MENSLNLIIQSQTLQEIAEELRIKGLSYQDIATQLNISKSSAYRWSKHINLDENQRNNIWAKRNSKISQTKCTQVKLEN